LDVVIFATTCSHIVVIIFAGGRAGVPAGWGGYISSGQIF